MPKTNMATYATCQNTAQPVVWLIIPNLTVPLLGVYISIIKYFNRAHEVFYTLSHIWFIPNFNQET